MERPPQLKHKVIPNQIKFQRKNILSLSQTNGIRESTFLTAMNVDNLQPAPQQNKSQMRNITTADSQALLYPARRNIP
jgi:hypothetical protein